jgi:hypothetical protein
MLYSILCLFDRKRAQLCALCVFARGRFSRQDAKHVKGKFLFIFLSVLCVKGQLKFETRISKSETNPNF